ncbi:ATP-grasp domain-containing protein [Kitasatospora sp. NPDC093550]|uniref:ATP-grasp domain-containing protein n=1 Tax=Kitasatospora sp. NPDC093550 TaxID=3364089 RepID=UPI00382C226A
MNSADRRPVAVVVDGYSAGNFYPAAFARIGADLVHVQSTPELITSMAPPNFADYLANVVGSDERDLVERLRAYSPVCVVAGQDGAVPMADRLGELLGVPSNGSALSRARRDKYEMIETLRRAGVRCARQFKSTDPAAVAAWAQEHDGYPVVVKPLSSAGSDGVRICRDVEEVVAAAEAVLASQNIFGASNTEILVQSYLRGTEYIVDTVSCDGQRYTCGVWEYEKTLLSSGRNIYNRDLLVDPDGELVPALTSYIDEVLAALDVRWGPAHAEVIVTEDGPVLVEIGTRLNGNLHADFHDLCLGHNQAGLTAEAYVRPERFTERYGDGTYRKLRPAAVYNAPTAFEGVVASVDQSVVDEIAGLESVFSLAVKLRPGARITPTVDLLTSPLRAHLTAEREEQLTADYERLAKLKDHVYRLA